MAWLTRTSLESHWLEFQQLNFLYLTLSCEADIYPIDILVFPALKDFQLKGVGEYLEDLVTSIDTSSSQLLVYYLIQRHRHRQPTTFPFHWTCTDIQGN